VCGKEEKMRGAPKVDVVMKVGDSLVRKESYHLSQRELQFVRPIISGQVQEFSNLAENHVSEKYSPNPSSEVCMTSEGPGFWPHSLHKLERYTKTPQLYLQKL
jgi:hypothetical protein